MARDERMKHMQMHPGWSARDNYGVKKKRGSKGKKREKSQGENGGKFNDVADRKIFLICFENVSIRKNAAQGLVLINNRIGVSIASRSSSKAMKIDYPTLF